MGSSSESTRLQTQTARAKRPGWRPSNLRGSGHADQMTLGIGEVPDRETRTLVHLGAHRSLAAEALGPLECDFHVGDAHIEECVAVVARPAPDSTRDPRSVARRVAVDEAVVTRLGDHRRDGSAGIELPVEQSAVEAAQLFRILSGDFEVDN